MRLPSRGRGGGLKFNITPMIDVVFNLIIFFLAASHLARSEVVEQVDLPEAGTSQPEQSELQRRLILTITPDEKIHVSGNEYKLPQIEQLIVAERGEDAAKGRDFEVRIRTDRRVPYRTIEPLLLACARAGVSKVKFAVLPKER